MKSVGRIRCGPYTHNFPATILFISHGSVSGIALKVAKTAWCNTTLSLTAVYTFVTVACDNVPG